MYRNLINVCNLFLIILSISGCKYMNETSEPREVVYTATERGGLIGKSYQKPGEIIKEKWMDKNGNIKIDGMSIPKTTEIIVVPKGTVATITIPDNSSWDEYFDREEIYTRGVFFKNRKVKLDPYVMGQYHVTKQLYSKIINKEDNISSKPIYLVNFFESCVFCNEMTKKIFGENTNEYVYYSDEEHKMPYTIDNANNLDYVYISFDFVNKKWTKKGYRLPTEAEYEFAARGGNPNSKEWKYAFAGIQSSKKICLDNFDYNNNITQYLVEDKNLNDYGIYLTNKGNSTYPLEVGLKRPNSLSIYDMSGNLRVWCSEFYSGTTDFDKDFMIDGYSCNPFNLSKKTNSIICRGGMFNSTAFIAIVSIRGTNPSKSIYEHVGIRLVRSIIDEN